MASLIKRNSIFYIQYMSSGKAMRESTGTEVLQIAKEKLRQFESARARGGESLLPTKTPLVTILAEYIEHIRTAKTAKSAQTDKKDAMASLLKELNAELERPNVGYLPSEDRKTETEQAVAWTRLMLGTVAAEQGWLDSVISKAAPTDLKKAKTLQDVITEYNALRIELVTQARIDALNKNLPAARKIAADSAAANLLERATFDAERTTRVLRAELEEQRVDNEMKLKRLTDAQEQSLADLNRQLAEAKATRAKLAAETEVIAHKGEMDAHDVRRRQKCHDPEVARILAPLLAKGYWQPGDRDYEPSSLDATPISLKKLQTAGALGAGIDSIRKLYDIGEVIHGTRDRSVRWSFKQFEYMPPEELEQLKLAHKYLKELGDALVEEGMLTGGSGT